jgi:hypothetical protein
MGMATPSDGPSTDSTSCGSTGNVYVIYVYGSSWTCDSNAVSDYSRCCAPAEEPPVDDHVNGDLSYLYRPPMGRPQKPVLRFDRRSEPRWRPGRWKSKA